MNERSDKYTKNSGNKGFLRHIGNFYLNCIASNNISGGSRGSGDIKSGPQTKKGCRPLLI